jgi:hypothetical protein
MSKMTKDKRDKMLLTAILALGTCACLYYLVITDMKDKITELEGKIGDVNKDIRTSERYFKNRESYQTEMEKTRALMEKRQEDMLKEGEDNYRVLNLFNKRIPDYDLWIAEFKQPQPETSTVLPKFPFKSVSLTVALLGTYQNLGRFLADFENDFPYMRVQLVQIAPYAGDSRAAPEPGAADSGRLRLEFKLFVLIRSQL